MNSFFSFHRRTSVQIISHSRAEYLSQLCEIIRTAVRKQKHKNKMIRLIQCFILFVVLFSLPLSAQNIQLTGKVTEQTTNKPLPGVIVTLSTNSSSKVLKFAQTNAEGIFVMTLADRPTQGILNFSMMGYARLSLPLKTGQTHYNAQLTEQATNLKEVVVKARGIGVKGDTISYNVSKYASEQDKTLADVLKKLPGIEVADNGSIKFNGKPINKFYIEGKDLLDGRYGMATNNIHQKDIGAVDVMDNHQPIKALGKLAFSDDPAINIRLKDKARSRWAGTLKIGGGVDPALWNAELFAMRFTKTQQILNVYKTNNIGTDIWKDMSNFSLTENFHDYNLQSIIDVSARQLEQLDSRRSRFNKTHMFSTNNLWGLGKDYDLTSSISYLNNRLHSDSYSETTYYLDNGKTNITKEDEHALTRQNRLNADIILKANTDKYYLQNKLNMDLQWNNTDMGTEGTYPNRQHSELPSRKITDSFDWIKRKGDSAFELCSSNSWQQKPQHLTIKRDSLIQHQDIKSSAFSTDTYTQLRRKFYPFTLATKIGLEGLFRSFTSNLTGINDTIGVVKNHLSLDYLRLYVIPTLSLSTPFMEAILNIPITYNPYHYKNKIADRVANKELLILSPSLYLRYIFSPHLALTTTASIQRNNIDEQSFFEGYILSDYQHIRQGIVDYSTGNKETVGLNLNYRNPLSAIFAYLQSNISWVKGAHSTNRSFLGDYIVYSYLPQNNFLRFWYLDGEISKGIDAANSTVSLNASYQTNKTSIYQNSIKTNYTSSEWDVTTKWVERFTQWLNINYTLEYSRNILKMTGSNTHLNNLSQTLQCNIAPLQHLYIQLGWEYYRNEIMKDMTKNCLLADADITYRFKKGWELDLSAQNVFNRKQYSYRMYNGTMDVYEAYHIRPRNITLNVSFNF